MNIFYILDEIYNYILLYVSDTFYVKYSLNIIRICPVLIKNFPMLLKED